MVEPIIVSRCDRIGDLVLSLPVLGFLRDAGFEKRVLHCAPYTEDLGLWAHHNKLCTELWIAGKPAPQGLEEALGLSLFHSPITVRAFKELGLKKTWGPRSKLSALWSYGKSIPQHRSRVEKSEMQYNLDLARRLLEQCGLKAPDFIGLPALKIPPEWTSPETPADLVIVLCNGGSAENWPVGEYLREAREALSRARKVDFLVSGLDAPARKAELLRDPLMSDSRVRLVENFPRLRDLISYLAAAREVLASSTGPLHLAHAAGIPATGLFPRLRVQSFERWRPDGYWHSAALRFVEI
jgi:ADP-heptose:LPS heptosyltransferase